MKTQAQNNVILTGMALRRKRKRERKREKKKKVRGSRRRRKEKKLCRLDSSSTKLSTSSSPGAVGTVPYVAKETLLM